MPLDPVADTEKVPDVKGALGRTCKRLRWAIKGVKGYLRHSEEQELGCVHQTNQW